MNEENKLADGVRIADEAIYLNRPRSDEPKEIFKLLLNQIGGDAPSRCGKLLDVGCAAGEFIEHVVKWFPFLDVTGIDVVPTLLDRARKTVPVASFQAASILDDKWFSFHSFDIITCTGVIGIFDDIERTLGNLLRVLNPGGSLYVLSNFNDHPVDVVLRYRRSEAVDTPWETGWNVFSKRTIERICKAHGPSLSWAWIPFQMPFSIPESGDPLRTWTVSHGDNPFQLVNGFGLLVNAHVLCVKRDR